MVSVLVGTMIALTGVLLVAASIAIACFRQRQRNNARRQTTLNIMMMFVVAAALGSLDAKVHSQVLVPLLQLLYEITPAPSAVYTYTGAMTFYCVCMDPELMPESPVGC